MIHLVDSDTLCYMAAATAASPELTRYNCTKIIDALFAELNVSEYKLYLTGNTNFRYNIYPEYKAQRLKTPKPEFLGVARDFLIHEWKADVSEGCEADDMLSIDQLMYINNNIESRIVSVDKDLDQVIGNHYNPRSKTEYIISPNQATRFFYYQLLVGDSADNIKGATGIGKVRATKILQDCVTPREHYEVVKDYFNCDEELDLNAQVLYLWKRYNDKWEIPT